MGKRTWNPLKRISSKAGMVNAATDTWWTTPWAWRTDDGVYVGHNREVWLYRQMAVAPMLWEDPDTRLAVGNPLSSLLYEIGATTKDMGSGMKTFARTREIHLLSLTWDAPARVPDDTPAPLAAFLENIVTFDAPAKALVVGVKLWSSLTASTSAKGVLDGIRNRATSVLGEAVPNLDLVEADRKTVAAIMARNGAHLVPTPDVRSQMESWYNLGNGPDATVYEARDVLYVEDADRIEVAAVMRFDLPMMYAPDAPWAMAATTHDAPASVISVRGTIQPSSVARARVRKSQRHVINQIEEEEATGDIARPEQSETLQLAEQVERFILSGNEPLISDCSILLARRVRADAAETYIDELRDGYRMELKPLEHRQMAALDETLPTSSKRLNPFLQDVSVDMLAHAGMQAFSNLGDGTGIFTGLVDPDFTPLYTSPLGAPKANKPPVTLVAGDPGSGKTMFLQFSALQCALAGLPTVFINPKAADDLSGVAELCGGRIVNFTDVASRPGFFDPARYTPDTPEGRSIRADIATQHILAVLGSRGVAGQGFTQDQEIALIHGLKEGFLRGARCVAEALTAVPDPAVRDSVLRQAADPLFALGIGMEPAEAWHGERGLVLIQFNRPLDIPEKGLEPAQYTRTQRCSVAAVRLVTRAALELLAYAKGGVLVVDEAWMFLQSNEGLAALQSLGRLGRSQNIWPIFATQRVNDLIRPGIDMESYLSRVLVMKMIDEREARAALTLCGLEPTQARVDWLRTAGPQQAVGGQPARAAMGLHRDLNGRHAAVLIGPIPEDVRMALSTNPDDRARRSAR